MTLYISCMRFMRHLGMCLHDEFRRGSLGVDNTIIYLGSVDTKTKGGDFGPTVSAPEVAKYIVD